MPAPSTPIHVFVAVAIYISVGFLEQSALPAFLAEVEIKKFPNATKDQISLAVTGHMAMCTLSLGILAVIVAGWAGRLSDRFGRRTMACIPALGQAVSMVLLAIAAYEELDWHYVVAAWAAQGVCGGPFVFLAAAFAYIADHRQRDAAAKRGRAFAALDALLLYVGCIGPLVGTVLVSKVGFWGAFAACAGVYTVAALTFALAPPSPQPPAKPAGACRAWAASATPVMIVRALRTARLRVLCVAFLFAMGGSTGGAISVVFYGQRYLNWGQQQVALYFVGFGASSATMILALQPALSRLRGRTLTDHDMVRIAYLGPTVYFGLLGVLPRTDVLAFALLPIFALGPAGLPHFRALFSIACPDEAQGEQMSFVAALESLPQLYAAPLAALAFRAAMHTPQLVLVACAAVPLVATILLCLLPQSRRAPGGADEEPARAAALIVNETPAALLLVHEAAGASDEGVV